MRSLYRVIQTFATKLRYNVIVALGIIRWSILGGILLLESITMESIVDRIKAIMNAEAEAILNIPLDLSVEGAVKAILSCHGKVFTTGIGKAGYVAKKAASTFSTTGTPSVFLHPGDASHGDVGVISAADVLIAFSNSGKTREVLETIYFARKLEVARVITITGDLDSPMANQSDISLSIGHVEEICPLGLTPTSSTTAMTALADALALSVMELRGFTKQDFALRHHGGYLGTVTKDDRPKE